MVVIAVVTVSFSLTLLFVTVRCMLCMKKDIPDVDLIGTNYSIFQCSIESSLDLKIEPS